MIWLLASILCSAGLFLVFKALAHTDVHVLPAIVVNYFTCFLVGNLIPGQPHVFRAEVFQSDWVIPVACMGFLFITGFYSMGIATTRAGAAPASVASKMSVVIPALVAIVLFKEKLSWLQISGIVISLCSVFLMVEPAEGGGKRIHKGLWLLVLVFLASGAVDTGLNLASHYYGKLTDPFTMSTIVFGAAAVLGSLLFLVTRDNHRFRIKEVVGGVILGVINYASLVAMFRGIEFFRGQTAWFFAVNNIGVVAVSAIVAALFFKEKLHRSAYWGLGLALVSIILMNSHAFF